MRIAFAICFLLLATCFQLAAQNKSYHIIDSLVLGGEGGWDYLSVDTSAERLYISRSTRVQVVDLASKTIVGEIPRTMGVHGIALVLSRKVWAIQAMAAIRR